jgi:hypothetical protein
LTNKARTNILSASQDLIAEVKRRFGNATSEIFGIEPESLTNPEANYILSFGSADAIRNRAAQERNERSRRLLSEGVRGEKTEVSVEQPTREKSNKPSEPMLSVAEDVWEKGVSAAAQKGSRAIDLLTDRLSPELRDTLRFLKC